VSDVVDGGAAVAAPVAGSVGYVVQVRDASGFWSDVATVEVPRRTKRRTVVERALAESPSAFELDGEPVDVRVLSPEDARPFRVSTVARDPELRIEGA
jgi:hypothetical protein